MAVIEAPTTEPADVPVVDDEDEAAPAGGVRGDIVRRPCRAAHLPSSRAMGPATVADRSDRAVRRHRAVARHHDRRDDERRPLQPDQHERRPHLRSDHADRRRHGRPRLGPGLPPRPPAAELPAVGLEHGLVRRDARLPVLHGRAGAGDRRPRHRLRLRRGVQARRDLRPGQPAVLLLGVRPPGPLPLPDAGALRLRRHALRPRRELQHLRRKPEVDDGRRVLVLDRPQPDDPRLRPARPRHADRAVPQLGGHRARPRRRVPRDRRHLHGDRGARHRPRQHRRMEALLFGI